MMGEETASEAANISPRQMLWCDTVARMGFEAEKMWREATPVDLRALWLKLVGIIADVPYHGFTQEHYDALLTVAIGIRKTEIVAQRTH